jgi:hypothetical protein
MVSFFRLAWNDCGCERSLIHAFGASGANRRLGVGFPPTQADSESPGARILGQASPRGVPVEERVTSLNESQAEAVASALGRDTTFVWGPPGNREDPHDRNDRRGAVEGRPLRALGLAHQRRGRPGAAAHRGRPWRAERGWKRPSSRRSPSSGPSCEARRTRLSLHLRPPGLGAETTASDPQPQSDNRQRGTRAPTNSSIPQRGRGRRAWVTVPPPGALRARTRCARLMRWPA